MAKNLPKEIADDETLGRSMCRSNAVKRARGRGVIIRDVFKVRHTDDRISVDRMDYADTETMASLARARAENNEDTFHGWAVLSAGDAREDGAGGLQRTVIATPFRGNCYHADIVMAIAGGLSEEERRDAIKQHALVLATRAKWRPGPD